MKRYQGSIARTAGEIVEVQRARWRVYGLEEKLLPASVAVDGREIDARDDDAGTVHFAVRAGGEVVGTVRLQPASRQHATTGGTGRGCGGLDVASKVDLAALSVPGIVLAEVTRFCVLRAYRGTGVTPALFAALRAESERRGITHWVAAANTETDVAEDALIAYRIARANGLVSTRFHVSARAPAPAPTAPPTRPGYTDEQRRRARAGELAVADLDLPRTLSVFARRMGARFIGGPVFDPYFGVFALPLVVVLDDVRVATSTTYPVSPTGANAASRPPPSPGGGS